MSKNLQHHDIRSKRPDNVNEVSIRVGLEGLTPERISTLYRRAPLHRPVGFRDQLWKMFENAAFVVTAWQGDRLLAVTRVLSDKVMFSYICDFAVEPDVQGLGVGKQLLERVFEECKGTQLYIADSAKRSDYYRALGFVDVDNAFVKSL